LRSGLLRRVGIGQTPAVRAILSRVALVAFGLAVGLVVAEAGFQLGAALRVDDGPLTAPLGEGRPRMLTIGDSNTYGIYLEDRGTAAYPVRFEALWNADPQRQPITVLNVGYPGRNSSKARNALPAMLETIRPRVVTLMIGANDFWTVPEELADTAERSRSPWSGMLRRSRVYRLLYMLWRSLGTDEQTLTVSDVRSQPGERYRWRAGKARFGEETFDLGWAGREEVVLDWKNRMADQGWREPLRDNLLAMIRVVRRTGAEPVLATYPSDDLGWFYGQANPVIRTVAKLSSTQLVDLAERFRPLCPEWKCPNLLLPDHHMALGGHELAARTLLETLAPSP
jgi:hypothetical protein